MSQLKQLKYYSPLEEKLNVWSHAVGLILAIIATVFLINKALNYGTTTHLISYTIYGASMIMLYAASTSYHYFSTPSLRLKLKIFDHAAIYVLIAGTYTPFTLVTLKGQIGWILFIVSWSLAGLGVVLKVFFTGRFRVISTLAYVVMGWLIIFAIEPLKNNLPAKGVGWLMAGGIAYTVGAILYIFQKIKFNHAIFHVFVLAGSICHFISIYYYVLNV